MEFRTVAELSAEKNRRGEALEVPADSVMRTVSQCVEGNEFCGEDHIDYDVVESADKESGDFTNTVAVEFRTVAELSAEKSRGGEASEVPVSKNAKKKVRQLSAEDSNLSALRKKCNRLENRLHEVERDNRRLKERLRRRNKKLSELPSNTTKTERSAPSVEPLVPVLPSTLNSTTRVLFERILEKLATGGNQNPEFPDELKRFAVQLDYISPKAYLYVRDELHDALPTRRSMRRWYQTLDCSPGFSQEAFSAVKLYSESQEDVVWCQFIFDEIHIHSHLDRTATTTYGFTYLGDTNSAGSNMANEILAFMLVSLDMKWKMPIGYFPLVGIDASQKARLILQGISMAEEAGVRILGMTFDGAKVNVSAMEILGCNLKEAHSSYTISQQINGVMRELFVYPDPSHMVKLLRNHFATNILVDSDGNEIDFKFVRYLHERQKAAGSTDKICNNQLKEDHMQFQKDKMNVRLAVQLMSRSVADAIDYCRDIMRWEEFQGSEATTQFIRVSNDSYDVCNSYKVSQTGLKSPLRENNVSAVKEFGEEAGFYLTNLRILQKNKKGERLLKPITDTNSKTGFIGMRACLMNLPLMYGHVKEAFPGGMMTYPLLQDHLEHFFGELRTKLGCNDNPTVLQFQAAFKKLITCVHIGKMTKGNCNGAPIFLPCLRVDKWKANETAGSAGSSKPDVRKEEMENIVDVDEPLSDETICSLEFSSRALLQPLKQKVVCKGCWSSLIGNSSPKSSGSPSNLLMAVCKHCEIYFSQQIKYYGREEFLKKFYEQDLVKHIGKVFNYYVFQNHLTHFKEHAGHFKSLLQIITVLIAKKKVDDVVRRCNNQSVSDRRKLHRQILFKHK